MAKDDLLDPRARQLLRTLSSRHIRDGAPVGSQTLARHRLQKKARLRLGSCDGRDYTSRPCSGA